MCDLKYVPQRWPAKDCVIATLATVTHTSYVAMAESLGIHLDDKTGLPDMSGHRNGVDILDVVFPLFQLGWSAAVIVTQEGFRQANIGRGGPSSDVLKTLLKGRPAVIGYTDPDPNVGEHSLAWDGTVAVDCSNGKETSLDNTVVLNAIVMTPLPLTK